LLFRFSGFRPGKCKTFAGEKPFLSLYKLTESDAIKKNMKNGPGSESFNF
jgi:hypothetical protein